MKNLFILILSVFMISSIQAQLKVGVHGGAPVGDAKDIYQSSWGINGYYMFGEESDALIKFGVGAGWIHYLGDEVTDTGVTVEYDDASFLPLYAAGRINFLGLFAGIDAGYAIGLTDVDGGFYWKPMVGVGLFKILELNLFYHSIYPGDGVDISSVGLGLYLKL
ncbi:hypothetical protein OO013_02540 [Mangrovivirga sp. M17]|uniref:Outer membrane protein beta-barrel domain-containing protein n=1 Tax=Mangrovivirga halotolerans TaxID=2993936 RepID=A0ABT3RLN9_9BACT|nr:hypothetical protein [Mangrovivirga halotolerans]MCX2742724.1 hypothetical protein [Mangrovivirga halotolerans]